MADLIFFIQSETGRSAEFQTIEEFEKCLDQLEANHGTKAPLIVIVSRIEGTAVYYGVGGGLSFVSNCEFPNQTTVGNPNAEGEKAYFFEGHHSPIPNRNLVPREFARKALRELCLTGAFPEWQTWEPLGS